jgi:hypothetical protein
MMARYIYINGLDNNLLFFHKFPKKRTSHENENEKKTKEEGTQ